MNKLLFSLLFLLPFIIFPIGTSPFEAPKVYLAEIGIGVMLLWYLMKHPIRSLFEPRNALLGGLGLLGIVHMFLTPSQTLFFGNPFRMSGVFLFELLLICALLSAKIPLRFPSQKFVTVLLGLQFIAAAFIQTKVDYRAIGTLGEANSLAAFVIFLLPWLIFLSSLPLTLRRGGKKVSSLLKERNKNFWGDFGQRPISYWLRESKKFWSVLGFILGILIILFSGSRSGVAAFLTIGVFYLLQRYMTLKAAVIISLVLFASSLALPFLKRDQLFENRATIWQTAVAAGFRKPLLGWGPGNTEIALQDTASRIETAVQYEYVDHSHNIFLEYWIVGGGIGLGAFIILLFSAFRTYYRQERLHEFAALLGLLLMLSFNPLSIAIMVQFWWLIGRSFTKRL